MKSAVKQEVSEVLAITPHSTQTQNCPERQDSTDKKMCALVVVSLALIVYYILRLMLSVLTVTESITPKRCVV